MYYGTTSHVIISFFLPRNADSERIFARARKVLWDTRSRDHFFIPFVGESFQRNLKFFSFHELSFLS